ncbi:hypothetical protein AB0B89_13245 [Sphaerisporangium sp. NPDC049002]
MAETWTTIGTAAGMFAGTNIDDIIVPFVPRRAAEARSLLSVRPSACGER